MNRQEKIQELEDELYLAENYPFFKNKHDVAEALVERGFGNVKKAVRELAEQITRTASKNGIIVIHKDYINELVEGIRNESTNNV